MDILHFCSALRDCRMEFIAGSVYMVKMSPRWFRSFLFKEPNSNVGAFLFMGNLVFKHTHEHLIINTWLSNCYQFGENEGAKCGYLLIYP